MEYLILILIFLLPIVLKYPSHEKTNYYRFECLVIILMMGFRNYVGGDTMGYMVMYSYAPTLDELTPASFIFTRFQPLWVLFESFCKTLSSEFYVLQLILSTFVNVTVFWLMNKYAKNRFYASFLYVINFMLNYNCEIFRAVISICIFFYAYEFLLQKKYVHYYFLVFVALLFHDQSVVLLIVPFLLKYVSKPFSLLQVLSILLIGAFLVHPKVMSFYVQFMGERGKTFMQGYGAMQIGSAIGFLRASIEIVLIYFLSKTQFVRQDTRIYPLFNLSFLCTVLGIVMPIFSTRVSEFFELYYYIILSSFFYAYRLNFLKAVVICLWLFSSVRWYVRDVTNWVTTASVPNRYYFYERFYPYYRVGEELDPHVIIRRKEIADQEELKK